MSFQLYIDGSGGGQEILVLAGYVSSVEKWKCFNDEWKKELSNINARSYTASKMHHTKSKVLQSEKFYRIIERHVDVAISSIVYRRDIEEAVRSIQWPKNIRNTDRLKNPYYFSFKAIADVFMKNASALGVVDVVDFIFDRQSEEKVIIDQEVWSLMKMYSDTEISEKMGSLSYCSAERTLPLQAADMYAYWIRRWAEENNSEGIKKLDFPWVSERDIPRLSVEFSIQDLIYELSKGLNDPEVHRRAQR